MDRAHGTTTRYHHGPDENGAEGKGCRCPACTRQVTDLKNRRTRLQAYGQWEPYVDATGTRRRLQALMYIGVPLAYTAGRLGVTSEALRQKMGQYRKVIPVTAAKVAALTRELHVRPPAEATAEQRRAADRARRHARRMGWIPLAAWDEIDDPAAVPVPGWDTPSVAAAIRAAREQAGLSQRRLAALIGVSSGAVSNWEEGRRTPEPRHWVQLELTLGPLGVVRDTGEQAEDAATEESDAA